MNPDWTGVHRSTAAAPRTRHTVIDRLAAIANRHRTTGDMPRLLERWIDDHEQLVSARWVERTFPAYEVAFMLKVRGRELPAFVDYHAGSTYLALHVYWPVCLARDRLDELVKLVNEINWDLPYGGFELRGDTLRYHHGLDVDGLRLIPAFIDAMVEHARQALELHSSKFLGGPIRLATA